MKNFWKKILAASVLLLAVCVTFFALQLIRATKAPALDIAADLKDFSCSNDDRLASVKRLFAKKGVDDSDLRVERFGDVENLVITKPGRSAETIIVGAHYDKTDAGCGVVDNWTGIVIMANLFQNLSEVATEKTYKFVAFGGEERGLLGSKAMAAAIPAENLKNYCAMVNFDSFGFSYPQALGNASDARLIEIGESAAKELDISFSSVEIVGTNADSTAFLSRNIRAVTFHGLSNDWKNYLHTNNDQAESVAAASVELGFRFGLGFLSEIDSLGCSPLSLE